MLHHPAHDFGASRIRRFVRGRATGALVGRRELADVLTELGVSLVLAGHRHALDPAQGSTSTGQPPLHLDTLQLVADSPTLTRGGKSFSLYRLDVDDPPTKVTVVRQLARYRPGIGERFDLAAPDMHRELPLLH